MNILVDIGHPAHVHFFRNAINIWQKNRHSVKVTTRGIPTALRLLDAYGIPFEVVSRKRSGAIGLSLELVEHSARLLPRLKKWKINTCVSIGGTFTVFAGATANCRKIIFLDTETARTANKITLPFADMIMTPETYPDDLGKKQVRYTGFHEMAYLHPDQFKPSPQIPAKYGIAPEEPYSIVRFISWEASHDIGVNPASVQQKKLLIRTLARKGKVCVIPENSDCKQFNEYILKIAPEDFHTLLYYALCCVTEGATTAAESAFIGTPTLYINPVVPAITRAIADKTELKLASPGKDICDEVEKLLLYANKKRFVTTFENITDTIVKSIDPLPGS